MKLTDELIRAGMNTISVYVVGRYIDETGMPLEEALNKFLKSQTCKLLNQQETGLFWDSPAYVYTMFLKELTE